LQHRRPPCLRERRLRVTGYGASRPGPLGATRRVARAAIIPSPPVLGDPATFSVSAAGVCERRGRLRRAHGVRVLRAQHRARGTRRPGARAPRDAGVGGWSFASGIATGTA
jgi:hypothetical protein